MSPKRARRTVTIPGFPRVSGDEPTIMTRSYQGGVFSPRERG